MEALQNTQGKMVLLLKSGAIQDNNLNYEVDLKKEDNCIEPFKSVWKKEKKVGLSSVSQNKNNQHIVPVF